MGGGGKAAKRMQASVLGEDEKTRRGLNGRGGGIGKGSGVKRVHYPMARFATVWIVADQTALFLGNQPDGKKYKRDRGGPFKD